MPRPIRRLTDAGRLFVAAVITIAAIVALGVAIEVTWLL